MVLSEINNDKLQEEIEELKKILIIEQEKSKEIERRLHQVCIDNRNLEEYIQTCTRYNVLNNLYLGLRKQITRYEEIKVIKKSKSFDEQYYIERYPHTINRSKTALEDYVINGTRERLSPNVKFNAEYYLAMNHDVRKKNMNPLYHYIKYGFYEGRRPNESADMYLEWCQSQEQINKYTKLLVALKNGYYIYKSGLFDGEYYLQSNEDVKETLVNGKLWKLRNSRSKLVKVLGKLATSAITHYVRYGVYEGRNPNASFNTSYYINQNLDILREKNMNPFTHYVKYGINEGRKIQEDLNIDDNLIVYIRNYIEKNAGRINQYNVGIIVPPTSEVSEIEHYIQIINAQDFKQYKVIFLDFENNPSITETINKFIGEDKESIRLKIQKEEWEEEKYYVEAFKALPVDIIWMPSLERTYTSTFLSKAVPYFIDSTVRVVSYKGIEKDSDVNYEDLNYATTGQAEVDKLFLGELNKYEKEDILFRNPVEEKWFIEKDWPLNDADVFNHFILRMLPVGNIVYVYDEYLTGLEVNNMESMFSTNEACKKHEELLNDIKELYITTACELKAEYEKVRTSYITTSGKDIDHFLGVYNIEKVMATDSKPRIMISIIAFTHGGGEIMPIRLANQLHEMGYPVIVHSSHLQEAEPKVRKMLNPNISVVEINEQKQFIEILHRYNIDVISTHHQGLQSFVAKALHQDEELREKINHVATSHGMYENISDEDLEYIFNQLNGNVDYWTYVADKNLAPFKAFDVYDDTRFIKIPNGMKAPQIKKIDRKELGISEEAFVVCTVSRAFKEKGWLETIESVKVARNLTDKDIQLILIGDGPLYQELLQTGVPEFVHLLGFRDNPCDYYGISNLAMLTSYYKSESAPLTIIEALFSNIPVIASNIGDVKQMLSVDTEIVGDVFDLVEGTVPVEVVGEKLATLIDNKEIYEQKVQLAKEKSKTFDIKNVAQRYLNVFKKKASEDKNIGKYMQKINDENLMLSNSCRRYHSPKVSVIVPNYNHEKYLRQRLDSIYNQTYRNLEVILMDDCSKDSSREILNEYAEKYPDITVKLFNEVNSGGVFYQWTKGIKHATGDICWIAESDDYCDLNFVEKLIPAFADSKVRISYSKYMFVNTKGEHNPYGFRDYVGAIDKEKWTKSYVTDIEDEVNDALAIKNTIPNASGALFRRPLEMELFEDKSWLNMRICGDWIFYLHVLYGGKIAYSVDTQSYFRFHDNNSSADTYSRGTYYKEHEMVACAIKDLYDVKDESLEQNYNFIKEFYFSHVKGTEMDLNKLFNIREILKREKKFTPTICIKEPENINKNEQIKTVVINPIFGAGRNLDSSVEEKVLYTGSNTGNLLFVEGVKAQLNYDKETWTRPGDIACVGNASAVMPSANFIIHNNDDVLALEGIALLEGTTCPVTLAGLGAQSTKELNTPKKLVKALTPTKVKFFKMISERATSLGVRGEFTAQCLEEMEIHNYRIIGCPSTYKYLDGVYPRLKAPTSDHVMFTTTTGNVHERRILEMGMENEAIWIMQMLTEMPDVALEGKMPDPFWMQYRFPGLKVTKEELKDYMEKHAKMFFRLKDWYEYYKEEQFTFAFGSRFHGNMSALQNGIPALWIVHDSRTTELVNTLKLPHIDLKTFDKVKSIEQLITYCDYEEFYKNYKRLTKEYVQFLEENNLNHKFTLD